MTNRDGVMKEKMMSIHVVIPVYNCKQYVKEAVDSVINQTYQNIDIVLIDDGSSDGSFEICDMIANKFERIHVIHQKNGGVSVTRNNGIEYFLKQNAQDLSNHYMAFLDADDCWEKDFLDESIQKLLRENYDLIGLQSCVCDQKLRKK